MTTIAGNIAAQNVKKTAKSERMDLHGHCPIGASGAVGTIVADDPGITLTKNGGTGDYTLAFPTAPVGRILTLYVVSPAATIKTVWTLSFDATTGAWNFITGNGGGTATNPASGDVIHFAVSLDVRG
jgi:hypothetical protein